MPGLRIMHYTVDVGLYEPTRIYIVMQKDSGDLTMEKIYQQKNMSLEDIYHFWQSLEVRKPIVLVDPHPRYIEFFKSKGIRVR